MASQCTTAALFVALASIPLAGAHADAFLAQRGGGKVIAGGIIEVGGGQGPVAAYRKFGLSMTAEYGVGDAVTIFARTESGSPWVGGRDARAGSIGVRRRLFDAGAVGVAAQVLAGVDAGLDRPHFSLEARLAAVARFDAGPAPVFFMVSAGPRLVEGEAVGARVEATLGARPLPALLLLAQVFGRLDDDPAYRRPEAALRAQASVISDLNAEWSVQVGISALLPNRAGRRERGLLAAVIRRF